MCAALMRIDPLNAENYNTWKLQMKAILIKDDLWSYVSGENPPPTSTDELRKWRNADQKACADLTLAISPAELGIIADCSTSSLIWEKLKATFESRGPAKKATLIKKIALSQLKEGDCVREYLNEYFDAVKKLKDIDFEIKDDLLVILLLYSLPNSFETFRCALETRDELPTPEALRVKILEEYESRKAKEERNEQQNALYLHHHENNNKQKQGQVQTKKNITCFKCGKLGHYAKNCRSKLNKYNSQKKQVHTDRVLYVTESAFYGEHSNKWVLDSGCTSHMTANKNIVQNIQKQERTLHLANNNTAEIKGNGTVKLDTLNLTLQDVQLVEGLRTNLLSVSKITDKGYDVVFSKNGAKIIDENYDVIYTAVRTGNLYYLKEAEFSSNAVEKPLPRDIVEWHQKLGHLNEHDLKNLIANKLAFGLNIKSTEALGKCEICLSEKQVGEKFPKSTNRASKLLEIVHSDVCGPFSTQSLSGAKYFVTFIDNYSRWCEVYFLKHKSSVFDAFKKYKAMVELKTGNKITCLQSDNGTEYCNKEFNCFLQECGITRRLTAPYTPQQNGISERKNRTLVEMARCIMKQAGAPPTFWAEAINTACYLRNRCPTKSLDGELPYKLWTNKTPTLIHCKIFGQKAYVLDKSNKGKLDSRSYPCIFVGYSTESKAYRLWSPKRRDVIISRDVKFLNESGFKGEYTSFENNCVNNEEIDLNLGLNKNVLSTETDDINENEEEDVEKNIITKNKGGRPRKLKTGKPGRPRKVHQHEIVTNELMERDSVQNYEEDSDSSSSNSEIHEDEEYESANLADDDNPTTLEQALQSKDAKFWRNALYREYEALLKNSTWNIIKKPSECKIIGNRFVFTTKDTGVKKVRLVAKGCSQRPGVDYNDISSPVVRSSSIRLLAALSAEMNLKIHQMDVIAAYLHGDLHEKVFLEVPEHLTIFLRKFISENENIIEKKYLVQKARQWLNDLSKKDNAVCELKKALYGLKQSGLCWYQKLSAKLFEMGLRPSKRDPCLFIARNNDKTILITIYVDDLLIASNDDKWINTIKALLSEEFDMKDIGPVKECLGIQFHQEENHVFMSQQLYTNALLERFNMKNCKIAKTPIEHKCQLRQPQVRDSTLMEKLPYQKLIGSLMYLAVNTRPDIAYAVNFLSQFNTNYNLEHWQAAKRVLRYLKGTKFGLSFQKTSDDLYGVVDADWASDVNDRRSYTGYAFILAGAAISWEARKQKTVALSSTEAEYMAISEATKEAIYLKEILLEVGFKCQVIKLYNDSQSAQKLAQNPCGSRRTKHIDSRHHFVKEKLENREIQLEFMPTNEMPADVLTKGLNFSKHKNCINDLGIKSHYFEGGVLAISKQID